MKKWNEHVVTLYDTAGYIVDSKDLNGAASGKRSIKVKEKQTLYVTITSYFRTKQFMMKPGNQEMCNISVE